MKYVETRLRFIQTHPAFSDRFESKNYAFLDCGEFEFIYILLKRANHTSNSSGFWILTQLRRLLSLNLVRSQYPFKRLLVHWMKLRQAGPLRYSVARLMHNSNMVFYLRLSYSGLVTLIARKDSTCRSDTGVSHGERICLPFSSIPSNCYWVIQVEIFRRE